MSILSEIGTKVGTELKALDAKIDNISVSGSSGTSSFKNKLINGEFDVWQRGTSFNGVNYYAADRWRLTGHEATITKTDGIKVKYNNTDGGTDNSIGINQTIETINSLPLVGKNVTLSVTLRKGSTFEGNLNIGIGVRTDGENLVAIGLSTSLDVTETVDTEYTTVQLSYIIPTDTLSIGANINQTNTTTIDDNNYYEVLNVQLEEGSEATSFETKLYGLELMLCQRYYWQYINLANCQIYAASEYVSGNWRITIPHPETMRIVPTVSINTKVGTPSGLTPTIYGTSLYHTSTYRMESESHYIKCDAEL